MNDIYSAILRAADSIEKHPDQFYFDSLAKPGCGSPGCALGWIGFHLGIEAETAYWLVDEVGAALGFSHPTHFGHPFYQRLAHLTDRSWKDDAATCAKALRLYAAKYHAPQFTGLPESVREIFAVKVGA